MTICIATHVFKPKHYDKTFRRTRRSTALRHRSYHHFSFNLHIPLIMIKILKTTPITLDGEDCLEVLIEDTHFFASDNCEACIYRDYQKDLDNDLYCSDVHNCSMNPSRRFIRLPLISNLPNLNLQ